MEEIINNCYEVFDFAGKCYPEVTIETIEKKTLPCYFTGVDYVALNPKDTVCGFNYFRLISENPVYTDVGGADKIITKMKSTYKWVVFSKTEINIGAYVLKFQKSIPVNLKLTIKSIQKNPNKLIKEECGFDFDLKVKKMSYFSVDFEIVSKYNNCKIECL